MDVWGIGTAVGGIANMIGAKSQAKAEIKQAEAAKRYYADKAELQGRLGTLATMFGPEEAERIMRGIIGGDEWNRLAGVKAANPNFTQAQQARVNEIKAKLEQPRQAQLRGGLARAGATGLSDQERDQLQAELAQLTSDAGGVTGQAGLIDYDQFKKMGPGVLGEYDKLATGNEKRAAGELGRFDADTFGLAQQAKDIEGQASRFGKQRTERVKRDSADALKNANALATSSLMGRGLGASTSLTEALTGNARENARAREDALGNIEDSQIGLQTGLASNRLNMATGRATGRTALSTGFGDQTLGLRQGAINARQSVLGGSVMNPYLGTNVSQYFPGVSPAGQALGAFGQGLTSYSSFMQGYGMGNQQGGTGGGTTSGGGAGGTQGPGGGGLGLTGLFPYQNLR